MSSVPFELQYAEEHDEPELGRASSALSYLDSGCSREEWVRIGMAAKSAGLSFDEFHKWSVSARNYVGESDCRAVWNSFREDGPVTERTLFAMAYEQGWQDSKTPLQAAHRSGGENVLATLQKTPVAPVKPAVSAAAAEEVWARCKPATPEHGYIVRKQGMADGLRIYPHDTSPFVICSKNVAGWLVVPCRDLDGHLQTLHFIPPEKGDKLNLPGATFGNGLFIVGSIADSNRVFVVEGIGQAWAAWKATGCAAVVCFGAGRMEKVAQVLRSRYLAVRMVVLPDRGKENQVEAIARTINGEWCELPQEMEQNADVNDFMQKHGASALSNLLDHTKTPPQPELPLNVVFADELPNTFTPPDELVEGVLTVGAGSVLYGESNSGKTFFVIDMACAIARGVPWMGRKTESGLVVYLAAESPESVRSRLQAYQQHHEVKVPNFAIVQDPIDLFANDADTDAVIQTIRQLERERGQQVRLIIGDTLARLTAGANENAGQDMGLVVRRIDRIRAEFHVHFLLIHHSGKNAANGARGWSGIRAAVDTEIEVTASSTGRCAEITKQRDLGTKGKHIGFRLETVELGKTKWGELATSCIAVPADAPMKTTNKRTSEVADVILDLLCTKPCGMKKREIVKCLKQSHSYDKSNIYRQLQTLVDNGQVYEHGGILTVANNEGAKGAE